VKITEVAGIGFSVIMLGVVGFQIALAAGAPWGAYAMGGAFPGQFPSAMRVAALVQAVILLLFAGVVLARAGVAVRRWSRASRRLIWLVVAFSTLSLVLNLITPSAGERAIWAPVALVLLVCSLLVALGKPAGEQ
jgi:uncharacterized membrane protein YhaH (DUF805 family)